MWRRRCFHIFEDRTARAKACKRITHYNHMMGTVSRVARRDGSSVERHLEGATSGAHPEPR